MGTNTTSFYLDPPQLIGRPNADGTVTLTPLELKRLNDFNYAVSKMLQGNLNLANLNAETNEVFTGMVTFTDLETGGSTVINGSNITTGTIDADLITTGTLSADRVSGGTIQGVVLRSEDADSVIWIQDGLVSIGEKSGDTAYSVGLLQYDGSYVKLVSFANPLKIESGGAVSIDAGASNTIWIGTSNSGETIKIGDQTSGTSSIYLTGNVYINGVLQ